MINKASAPHDVWGQSCSRWTLVDQTHLHVIQERMPPGSAERWHLHHVVRQLYYILDGVGTVRFNDRAETLHPGDAVEVPPATPHQLRNDSAGALEFLVISSSAPRADRVDLDR